MIASLPMYDFPELRAQTDALWQAIRSQLLDRGVADVPELLTRPEGELADHWRLPELLLSHTCGYPVVRLLPDLHVLGSFGVAAGGSAPPGRYRSVLVARADDGSLSGWISLGWAFSQADARPGPVVFTGAHAMSVVAVRDAEADLASIDAHSFALFREHRPDAVRGLVVVGQGPEVAVTPLITARGDLVEVLRSAVGDALEALPAEVLSALMINGWVPHGRDDHLPVLELARTALSVLR